MQIDSTNGSLFMVHTTGAEAILLHAVSFAIAFYPLRNETAMLKRAHRQQYGRDAQLDLIDYIKLTWMNCKEKNGLLPGPNPWNDPYIKSVIALHCDFELSIEQVRMLAEACRACILQFSSEWWWSEFCSAMPGSVGRFDIRPESMDTMKVFFENLLANPALPQDG